ncbi:MAG: hypothetical protein BRD55_11020 [Bacteroidetes bacterium SW_9_63_38]|nr:MAG: hypothetical protein BRD55_11020 [Bacteroidetes bacterium SW_9_63_38]
MSGAGTTRAEGGFFTDGGSTLNERRLVLAGGETGTFETSSNITGANGARLVIESGAVFEHKNNGNFEVGGGMAPRLVNRGTYQVTAVATAGNPNLYWELQNSGVLEVTAGGKYNISGQIYDSGETANRTEGTYRSADGPLELNIGSDTLMTGPGALMAPESGGTVQVSAPLSGEGAFEVGGTLDVQFPIFVDGGRVTLQGGQILRSTSTDTALVQQDGRLEGAGSITGVVVAKDGEVQPGTDGATGTVTVDGVYKQATGVRLNAELGGTTPGTEYDVLTANETDLAGELRLEQLSGFNPTTADTLRLVKWTGGVRTGQFDQISGQSTFDEPLKVQYDSGDNAVEVAGKILPGRDVDPTSFSDTLMFSKARTRSLRIENTATDSDAEDLEAMIQAQDNPSWLMVSPTSVSIPQGGTETIDVELSAQSTSPGTYRDTIEVTDPELDGAVQVPVQLTIQRPAITLSSSPTPASPGTAVTVEVGIPSTFTPVDGTLSYRAAGAETFQTTSMDVSGLTDNTEGTVSADVPGDAVTKVGVQYHVRLTGPDSTGSVTIHTPSGGTTRPVFVSVSFGEIQADGSFPQERYRMLTVPVETGDRSVFELLTDQYGSYDPAQWRFSRWNTAESSYREGSEVGPLETGQAAWLVVKRGIPLTVTGGGQSVDASAPEKIALQPGWNQVGNPFPFPVAWSEVTRPDPVRPPVGYDASRSESERFRFGVDVLEPWEGVFVYNSADTSVALTVPPVGGTSGSSSMTGRALTAKTGEGYRLEATASVSGGEQQWSSRPVQIGVSGNAEKGLGDEDRVRPPAVRSRVRLHVAPSEGPALARSVKPLGKESSGAKTGRVWDLRLQMNNDAQAAGPAYLRLATSGPLPEGVQRYVVDRDRNRRLVTTHGTAKVPLSKGQSPRQLRVIVGTEAFAKAHSEGADLAVTETKLRANAPNPFAESTTIPYQVAEEAHVRISVYDVLGRRVAVLVDGQREVGVHRVQWGPDDHGDALASGVYFCRMKAGGNTSTQKLVVVR